MCQGAVAHTVWLMLNDIYSFASTCAAIQTPFSGKTLLNQQDNANPHSAHIIRGWLCSKRVCVKLAFCHLAHDKVKKYNKGGTQTGAAEILHQARMGKNSFKTWSSRFPNAYRVWLKEEVVCCNAVVNNPPVPNFGIVFLK